jgi:tetratricopeptide (TPR) repeat protein
LASRLGCHYHEWDFDLEKSMNFNSFITRVQWSLQSNHGQELTNLFPWTSIESLPLDLLEEIHDLPIDAEEIQRLLQNQIPDPDNRILISLFLMYIIKRDFDSFLQALAMYNASRKLLQPWLIPMTRSLVQAIVKISIASDIQNHSNDARVKTQNELAKMRAFLLKESSDLLSNIYLIANASLQLYFDLKEVNQSLKVVDQIYQYVPKDCRCLKSDKVTFHYYEGRVYLYFHRFAEADEALERAFLQCPPTMYHNRRLILKYWIVARIVRGKVPHLSLLQKYQLDGVFQLLIEAFTKGDFGRFQVELNNQRDFLLKNGFYTIMQRRTSLLMYRNILCRIYRIMTLMGATNSHFTVTTFTQLFQVCLYNHFSNLDVESIIVSLIDQVTFS